MHHSLRSGKDRIVRMPFSRGFAAYWSPCQRVSGLTALPRAALHEKERTAKAASFQSMASPGALHLLAFNLPPGTLRRVLLPRGAPSPTHHAVGTPCPGDNSQDSACRHSALHWVSRPFTWASGWLDPQDQGSRV